jgi:hypothetical protein
MKTTAQTGRAGAVRPASNIADPLRPANLSLKDAERALKRQLPAVRSAVQRLQYAKIVSQKTLDFKFSI